MSVDFDCPYCKKRLSVPNETAGRQAKCPSCSAIVSVPTASEPTSPAGPRPLDLIDVFDRTWRLFKASWIECVMANVVVMAVNVFLSKLLTGVAGIFGPWLGGLMVWATSMTLGAWLLTGQIRFYLKVARGQPAPLETIFRGGDRLLPMLAAILVIGFLISIGLVLLVAPGVFIATMLFPVFYLIADRNVEFFEAIDVARKLTDGKRLMIFVIGLAAVVTGTVIILFTVGVGALVVMPCISLMGAVVYLTLAGEPTNADSDS